jgi:hypothetical protein
LILGWKELVTDHPDEKGTQAVSERIINEKEYGRDYTALLLWRR